MWADNETSEDFLGFKVHADLITDIIKDDLILPVTIGVFGDWGSGKSSVLKMVKEDLEKLDDGTFVLYFNGWVFEGYDDAKAALLESIIKAFDENQKFGAKVKDKTIKLLKSVKWMRLLGLGFKNIALPTAAAYFSGGASLLLPFLAGQLSKQAEKPEELINKLKENTSEDFLKSLIKEQPDNDEMMLVRAFRDDFAQMISKSEIKKLVVIIDDLDRCTPDRIIENLEAIKLFLNVDKTAFVIGADPRIVRHAIEFKYNTDSIENSPDAESRNKRIVSDYLEKLIQIPYNLPKLTDDEVETYLTLLFCKKDLDLDFKKVLEAYNTHRKENRYGVYGIGDLEGILNTDELGKLKDSITLIASLSSIITDGLNGNPRQIKRFLNTFMLRMRLVKIAKISDFKFDVLAKLMVLEYSNLQLFRKLYTWQFTQKGIPQEIIDLESFANNSDKDKIKEKISSDWASEQVIQWLNVNPKLTNVDLRDYFWISRDQLSGSITGSSIVPSHVRALFAKLINHGSGKILETTISKEVLDKLDNKEEEALSILLEKELLKSPNEASIHKVFIELMAQKISFSIPSYKRIIKRVDHESIPFSLRNEFILAEKKNPDIKSIYSIFNVNSKISKSLINKK